MDYQVLLFDLDQTLFDTDTNAQNALRQMDLPFAFHFGPAEVTYWHDLQTVMWADLEKKRLTRDELVNTRFERYFAHYGITADGQSLEQQFRRLFYAQHALMPHALETLTQLQVHYHLDVVSNEVRAKQVPQLTDSHLAPFFDHLFLAEDLGASKPDHRFFDTVKANLPTVNPAQMLVIGDSLTADILGANRSGIDSVWFNPHHAPLTRQATPTYQVESLLALPQLLQSPDLAENTGA